MERTHEDWIISGIRMLENTLKCIAIVFLLYQKFPADENLKQGFHTVVNIFQMLLLLASLTSMVIHIVLFIISWIKTRDQTERNTKWKPIQNLPFFFFNYLFGIGTFCICNIRFCMDSEKEAIKWVNFIFLILFIPLLFVFIPIYLKWKPKSHDKWHCVSAIISGSIASISCFFLSVEKISLSTHNQNPHPNTKWEIISISFFLISGILIHFPLISIKRKLLKHQYGYENLNNKANDKTSNEIKSKNLDPNPNLNESSYLYCCIATVISLLITLVPLGVLTRFTIPVVKSNRTTEIKVHMDYEICKLTIYVICAILSVIYIYYIFNCKSMKKLESKMDYFISTNTTLIKVANGIITVYLFCVVIHYKWDLKPEERDFIILSISSNILLILQVLLQKVIIIKILHRYINKTFEKTNPCLIGFRNLFKLFLILCLFNFGLLILNILYYLYPMNKSIIDEEPLWRTIKTIVVPFSILNRYHAFCIFLEFSIKYECPFSCCKHQHHVQYDLPEGSSGQPNI